MGSVAECMLVGSHAEPRFGAEQDCLGICVAIIGAEPDCRSSIPMFAVTIPELNLSQLGRAFFL